MTSFSRRSFVAGPAGASAAAAFARKPEQSDRDYWIAVLKRIADPVLNAASRRRLKADMPVEAPHNSVADRSQYTYLEALGRLLAGISPWLESGDNTQRYSDLARQAIASAVDPSSPDYMNFDRGSQPVVDAAFLALAILRAPSALWHGLDPTAQRNLVKAMLSTRVIRPGFNNWLLFSATIEAFLALAGEQWDPMRVDYAVRQHGEWYKGDGVYG